MAIRDEIREQQNKLKGRSLKERLGYFFDYYKLPVIIFTVIALLLFSIVREMAGSKQDGFYLLLINSRAEDETLRELSEGWYELLDIDSDKEQITVDGSLHFDPEGYNELSIAGITRVTALAASGSIDGFVSDMGTFSYYAAGGVFMDLRELYTESELDGLKGRLCYVDMAELDRAESQSLEAPSSDTGESDSLNSDMSIEGTGHSAKGYLKRSPESMLEPIPVGIAYEGSGRLHELGIYTDTAVFGVFSNSKRPEKARLIQAELE